MAEWDLVLAPLDESTFIARYLTADGARPALLCDLGELYLPALRRVGWEAASGDGGSPGEVSLRERLIPFLAFVTRTPESCWPAAAA
ncbi:MAG: hypothetical protein OEM05_18570 [Myxococcales bacterium]|nr:hypothetical protein [Myxococcales bacterium]